MILRTLNNHVVADPWLPHRGQAFTSRDVLLSTKRLKVEHARTVLAAQARQRASRVYDEEELSRLSRAYSEPAQRRAGMMAAGYWNVLR